MSTQHCSYWCPGAKASDHRYPQCGINATSIHCADCICPISYKNIAFKRNDIKNKMIFCEKLPSCLRVNGRYLTFYERQSISCESSPSPNHLPYITIDLLPPIPLHWKLTLCLLCSKGREEAMKGSIVISRCCEYSDTVIVTLSLGACGASPCL